MSDVSISVIVPTYNRAQYIRESVQSVICQSYENIEIIIVDDGSTDDTEQRLQEIDDKRVIYIRIPNSGRPAIPRNIGLERADGDYVTFLDSDDLWLPKKLEIQIPLMEARKDIDISYGNVLAFDEFSDRGVEQKYRWKRDGVPKVRLLFRNFIPLITVVIRRSFLECHTLQFNESLESVEDHEWCLRAAMFGAQFHFTNQILAKSRKHHAQLSNRGIDKRMIYKFLNDLPRGSWFFNFARRLAIMNLNYRGD